MSFNLLRRDRVVPALDGLQRRADALAILPHLHILIRNPLRIGNRLVRQFHQQVGIGFPDARRVALYRIGFRQSQENSQPRQLGLDLGVGHPQPRQLGEDILGLILQAGLLQLPGPRTERLFEQLPTFRAGVFAKADFRVLEGVSNVALGQLALCPLEGIEALL